MWASSSNFKLTFQLKSHWALLVEPVVAVHSAKRSSQSHVSLLCRSNYNCKVQHDMLHCTDKLYQSKTHQHQQCTQLQSRPYTNKGIYDFKVLFCFTINITAKIMKTKIKHWNLKRIHSKFQGSDLPSKSRAQDHIHIAQNLSWKTRLKGVVRWTIWMSKKIRVCLNLFYL